MRIRCLSWKYLGLPFTELNTWPYSELPESDRLLRFCSLEVSTNGLEEMPAKVAVCPFTFSPSSV
jgi:hypothetical protein